MLKPLIKRKPKRIEAIFALLVLFALVPSAKAATLVYSNDILAELEPCGCRSNPKGGVSRKQNILLSQTDKSLLQVDAGDFLFAMDNYPTLLKEQALLQARYVIKAHNLMGQNIVVPGERDFALGTETFLKLKKEAKFKFLAANIFKSNGKPILDGSAVFNLKKEDGKTIRVAVIGLVGSDFDWPPDLKIESPIEIAKKKVAQLKKTADLLIAVTHQGLDQDEILAKEVPELDIIIGGHTQSFLQTPKKIGKTLIFQSSFQNQFVGFLPLKTPQTEEGHQLIGLDESLDTGPSVKKTELAQWQKVVDLVKEFKTAVAKLNSKQNAGMLSADAKTNAHNRMGAAYQTFAHCADCHSTQFDFWRKTKHADALSPLVQAKQIRNLECLGCHTLGLGHANGFSNLDQIAERSDPTNLSEKQYIPIEKLSDYLKKIHGAAALDTKIKVLETDLQEASVDESLSSFSHIWAPVQCESCHQAAGQHPSAGLYPKAVANQVCLGCHTQARAPGWWKNGKPNLELIAQKRKLVTCPSNPAPTPPSPTPEP